MTARILWKQRETVRRIEKRACERVDPLERLRYVRKRMDSKELPARFRWWPARRVAALISAAIGVALLAWRIL